MNILIIEDEEPAANRLQKMILEIIPEANILNVLDTINSAIKWFETNSSPDLIFMDINLADGNSFEIFEKIKIITPIIFTTAYDEFALKAFKVNSVEYLLKPINKENLTTAINKFKQFHSTNSAYIERLNQVVESFHDNKTAIKKRFLIRYGEHIKSVDIENVAYFYTEGKINFLKTKDNHTFPIEYNLDKLESMINHEKFFRINRQFIINVEAIDQMFSYSKSRVKINLKPKIELETIVSTERSPLFKEWLSGKE